MSSIENHVPSLEMCKRMKELEEWRYYQDTRYKVYKDGRIYSDWWNRFMRPFYMKGYRHVYIQGSGSRKLMSIHRLVAETWLDNPENHELVLHKDDNRENNHVDNLMWGDRITNAYHAKVNGRLDRGPRKFTDAQVQAMIRERQDGVSVKNILERYNISNSYFFKLLQHKAPRTIRLVEEGIISSNEKE